MHDNTEPRNVLGKQGTPGTNPYNPATGSTRRPNEFYEPRYSMGNPALESSMLARHHLTLPIRKNRACTINTCRNSYYVSHPRSPTCPIKVNGPAISKPDHQATSFKGRRRKLGSSRLVGRIWAAALTLLLVVSMFALFGRFSISTVYTGEHMDEFVQRSGSELLLYGQRFRFAGANVYWMGLDENVDGIDYPTDFRVNDVLSAAESMGATVVRSHTLGISVGCSACLEPSVGVFNSQAFERIDYAIQAANNHHLRLLLPLIDNWAYYHGGRGTFTQWSGLSDPNDFYTNETVIHNFEQYIYTLLNHVNIYTKRAYKDDPTILGWETGNELRAPTNWVARIASFIKRIDPHHLVMDGNDMNSGESPDINADLALSDVDMYTGHYYPLSINALKGNASQVQGANKVFIVGEYDWTGQHGGDALPDFLQAIEQNLSISGDLYWSLFGRDDMGRYVQHYDGYTLHYPGDDADMRARVILLTRHAVFMSHSKT